jgi:hypothetical protein
VRFSVADPAAVAHVAADPETPIWPLRQRLGAIRAAASIAAQGRAADGGLRQVVAALPQFLTGLYSYIGRAIDC